MSSNTIILVFFSILIVSCTEPITPEFDFKSGLVSLEGFVSTSVGGSFVRINKINEFNIGSKSYQNVFIGKAEVPSYNKKNILVEIQRFSLSASAFEYYEVLKDIINDNGGFNSLPPAALIGNMYNPDDDNEFVLGRFTIDPASTPRVFIGRSEIEGENIVETLLFDRPEGLPPPLGIPEEWVFSAQCPAESRYNTSIRPEGWRD